MRAAVIRGSRLVIATNDLFARARSLALLLALFRYSAVQLAPLARSPLIYFVTSKVMSTRAAAILRIHDFLSARMLHSQRDIVAPLRNGLSELKLANGRLLAFKAAWAIYCCLLGVFLFIFHQSGISRCRGVRVKEICLIMNSLYTTLVDQL